MAVAVYPAEEKAEALSYQDLYSHTEVYHEVGRADLKAKRSLNSFLNTWLRNLIVQGHSIPASRKSLVGTGDNLTEPRE